MLFKSHICYIYKKYTQNNKLRFFRRSVYMSLKNIFTSPNACIRETISQSVDFVYTEHSTLTYKTSSYIRP